MRLQQEERAGHLGSLVGDTPVAGLRQHELLEWYFDHQTERCARSPARDSGFSGCQAAARAAGVWDDQQTERCTHGFASDTACALQLNRMWASSRCWCTVNRVSLS